MIAKLVYTDIKKANRKQTRRTGTGPKGGEQGKTLRRKEKRSAGKSPA
jgi:hypothetical protein